MAKTLSIFCSACGELIEPRTGRGATDTMVTVKLEELNNEVTGQVWGANGVLLHATKPRDAHEDGSIKATVARVLWELADAVMHDARF